MKTLIFKIVGETPLVMHSGDLADPLNPIVRQMAQVSAKRKKVDADHEELARLEWYGSLYIKEGKIIVPGANLEAMLLGRGGAARSQRMGPQARAGLFVPDDAVLEYDGPQELDELWKDENFRLRVKARIGASSVIRTRPKFDNWSLTFRVLYDPDILNEDTIKEWMEIASFQVGLGDWRPRYGRFKVVEVTED